MGALETEEHLLRVDVGDSTSHAVLEVPRTDVRGLVLLAHGLSASRGSAYLRAVAGQLHASSLASVSMDAPLHGSRQQEPLAADFEEWVGRWQDFWRAGGSARMVAEYGAILDACPESLSSLPIGYWGLSLGTQTGIPWLATDPRPRAAVLGLFRGDGVLMRELAPRVEVPIFFVQQLNDQLHSADVSRQLFDALGSERKILRSSPGGHADVPEEVLRESVTWLCEELVKG